MTGTPMKASDEWKRHWPLVSATTAGMALASMLTAGFGVMLEPIEQETGWTRAQISSGPAIVSMMGLFLAAPAGYLIDRLGARATGLFVIGISLVAIGAISFTGGQLWQWWAAWSIFGIAGAFTSTVWLAPVSTIFDKGRGMAIAITISGTGISMALVPPLAEYFVQNHDWRTGYRAIGLIWVAITFILAVSFVPRLKPKASAGQEQAEDDGEPAVPLVGLTPAQGFRTRNFYLLFFASLASAMTGVAIILNLVPVLSSSGLDRSDAVWIAGSMGIASIIGRLAGGWLMDHFDVRKLAIGASLVSVFFPLGLLLMPGVLWAAMTAVLAYGLTGGMKMNAIVYLVSTHLGHRSFGLFYGAISITTTIAMGIAPMIANHIFDISKTYTPVLWVAVPGFLLTALLFVMLSPAPDFGQRQPDATD